MITLSSKGDFKKTFSFFEKAREVVHLESKLEKYGREGVAALAAATPVDSGETAMSWYYKIEKGEDTCSIVFSNSHVVDGVNIAIILHYGHATRNGGYVVGKEYINSAIQPIFDKISKEAWKEVTS